MAIRVDYTPVGALGQAAQAAGQAMGVRAQKERQFAAEQQAGQQAFQERMFNLKQEADLEAEARSKSWEMEKMERASRLEFDKTEAAERWEIQKAQIRSQIDFERDEKKRQAKLDEFDNQSKALMVKAKEEGWLDNPEDQRMVEQQLLKIKMGIIADQPTLAQDLFADEYSGDKVSQRQAAERDRKKQAIMADTNMTPEEKADAITRVDTGIAPRAERQVFTPARVQEFLGGLMTGYAPDPQVPTMRKKIKNDRQSYETATLQQFGPNWRTLAPEAANFIDQKFGGGVSSVVVDTVNAAPKNRADFEAKTRQLMTVDEGQARQYYEKWNNLVGK